MFRVKSNPRNYKKRFSRLANSTKAINVAKKTMKRGGIKL